MWFLRPGKSTFLRRNYWKGQPSSRKRCWQNCIWLIGVSASIPLRLRETTRWTFLMVFSTIWNFIVTHKSIGVCFASTHSLNSYSYSSIAGRSVKRTFIMAFVFILCCPTATSKISSSSFFMKSLSTVEAWRPSFKQPKTILTQKY